MQQSNQGYPNAPQLASVLSSRCETVKIKLNDLDNVLRQLFEKVEPIRSDSPSEEKLHGAVSAARSVSHIQQEFDELDSDIDRKIAFVKNLIASLYI